MLSSAYLHKETFIYSEREDGKENSITYEEFDKQISKVGNSLKIIEKTLTK